MTGTEAQISLLGVLQTAQKVGMRVLKWSPRDILHEGQIRWIDARYLSETGDATFSEIREHQGGVTFVSIWPGNDAFKRLAAICFIGRCGRPRLVNESAGHVPYAAQVDENPTLPAFEDAFHDNRHTSAMSRLEDAMRQSGLSSRSAISGLQIRRAGGMRELIVGGARAISDVSHSRDEEGST